MRTGAVFAGLVERGKIFEKSLRAMCVCFLVLFWTNFSKKNRRRKTYKTTNRMALRNLWQSGEGLDLKNALGDMIIIAQCAVVLYNFDYSCCVGEWNYISVIYTAFFSRKDLWKRAKTEIHIERVRQSESKEETWGIMIAIPNPISTHHSTNSTNSSYKNLTQKHQMTSWKIEACIMCYNFIMNFSPSFKFWIKILCKC